MGITKYYTSVVQMFPFHSPTEMVQAAHRWCGDRLAKYQPETLFLPAGNTPKALYGFWEKERPSYLDNLQFGQVDELMNSGDPPLFRRFFQQELPSYAARIHPPGELAIENSLAILGLGKNGHVAFHEPHVPTDFSFGPVSLAQETCDSLGITSPAQGLTYGLATLRQAKSILLLIAGDGKEDAWQAFVAADETCPASHLRSHSDLMVLHAAR